VRIIEPSKAISVEPEIHSSLSFVLRANVTGKHESHTDILEGALYFTMQISMLASHVMACQR